MGGKKKSAESNSSLGKQLIKSKTKKVYMKGEGPGGLGFKVVSILFENCCSIQLWRTETIGLNCRQFLNRTRLKNLWPSRRYLRSSLKLRGAASKS